MSEWYIYIYIYNMTVLCCHLVPHNMTNVFNLGLQNYFAPRLVANIKRHVIIIIEYDIFGLINLTWVW